MATLITLSKDALPIHSLHSILCRHKNKGGRIQHHLQSEIHYFQKKHYIGQKVCPFHRSINEHLKNKNIRNAITDISEYRQPWILIRLEKRQHFGSGKL